MSTLTFWHALDTLVSTSEIVIDRPRGSVHPRYPDVIYPLDYGYLRGTTSGDGKGIDVWIGTREVRHVSGVILTVDLLKRDSEVKILLCCTPEEVQTILRIHDQSARGGLQSALLLERPD